MTTWLSEITCPDCGHKWQFVDLDAIEAAESDDLLPCLPSSTQLVRFKFKDMGPGQPRGDFEVMV